MDKALLLLFACSLLLLRPSAAHHCFEDEPTAMLSRFKYYVSTTCSSRAAAALMDVMHVIRTHSKPAAHAECACNATSSKLAATWREHSRSTTRTSNPRIPPGCVMQAEVPARPCMLPACNPPAQVGSYDTQIEKFIARWGFGRVVALWCSSPSRAAATSVPPAIIPPFPFPFPVFVVCALRRKIPSSPGQLLFLKHLAADLQELGAQLTWSEHSGALTARIPGNNRTAIEPIAFLAHSESVLSADT